jgi:PAS domain S-box-containing protein
MAHLFDLPAWIRRAGALPALILALGVSLSIAGGVWLHHRIETEARVEFGRMAEYVRYDIGRRFTTPLYGLRGALGALAASERMERAEFRAYVEARSLPEEFPGVRGLGFIVRTLKADDEAFQATERADGAPHFKLHELGPGDAPDRYVIKYIEPMGENLPALGRDVGSEVHRREAIERAVATGRPTLTAPIALMQDGRQSPGFLLFLPAFRRGTDPATEPQRRAALQGVFYAPIVASELLDGTRAAAAAGRLHFVLSAAALVYDSAAGDPRAASASSRYVQELPLDIVGSQFTLRARSSEAFEASIDRVSPWLALLGGLLLTSFLAYLARLNAVARERAEAIAHDITAELRRVATVARSTTDGVIILDIDRRIEWANDTFLRRAGYTADEAIGRIPGDLLKSEEVDAEGLRRLRAAMDRGQPHRSEVRNRDKDGQDYWIELEAQPVRDETGLLTGWVIIESDITERRDAARELARERERLQLILDGTGAGTWEVDFATGVDQINDAYAAMLGDDRTTFTARIDGEFMSIMHPDDRAAVSLARQAHLDGRSAEYTVEFRMRHRDGHWVWVYSRGRVGARDADGRPLRMAGTHIDISERKRVEAEAQRGAVLLRGAIEAIDEAFVIFDPDDRLVLCNERYREVYSGVADLLVPGARFEELLRAGALRGDYASARGRVDEWVAERLAAHRRADGVVHQQLDNGRTLRIVERRLPDGHTVGFRIDITEITRARLAAEEASRSKSQFVANMSHEIRTPMNAILGMLRLLHKSGLSARQADYAGKADGAARSLLGLLNDILDFSKAEAGKMILDPQPFRVEPLLRDLSVILSATVGSKPVALRFDIDPALPRSLVGDSMRLQQVLINLGGNAIKFTEQGEVVVRVEVAERIDTAVRLAISVRDTGIGIAPENHARIFSGFTQAEASTTRRFGGTGLGLAICQRLVQLMGGELELESALGQGSRFGFSISLPVAQDELPVAPAAAAGSGTRRLQGLRLLLAEDNPNNRQVACELLEDEGATVKAVDNGRQAVEAVAAAALPFDAVLMDLQMPEMDGVTATGRIRETVGLHELPIVAMTANAMASDREACIAAGMNDHVPKPFDLDHLVAVLQRLTGRTPPAAPAVPAPVPLPLAGGWRDAAAQADVDLDAALGRLGGRVDSYRRLLKGFVLGLPQAAADMQAMSSPHQLQDALRALHTHKGLAATLGALTLSRRAADAERALAGAAPPPLAEVMGGFSVEVLACLPALHALSDALRAGAAPGHVGGAGSATAAAASGAVPRSDAARAARADEAAELASADPAALRGALEELARLLADADMDALSAMDRLRSSHAPHLADRLEPLDDAVMQLDFERALQSCRMLMEETAE